MFIHSENISQKLFILFGGTQSQDSLVFYRMPDPDFSVSDVKLFVGKKLFCYMCLEILF